MKLTSGTLSKPATFAALPPVWSADLQPEILAAVDRARKTLVVLDDDPTGTQTVYDLPVITRWDVATLREELTRAQPCFYILTNSRSLSPSAARRLALELAKNLRSASEVTKRAFTLVSRGDSTLRGHFPVETDALAAVCGAFDATLLIPYFEEGGRYTLEDVHYVAEGDTLVPAAETPFARDPAFGYRHSHLRHWVEEKTERQILADEVHSLPLELLRRGGPAATAAKLLALPYGSVCVANLCAPRDAEVLAAATLVAEEAGKRYLYRTAASFVSARLGLPPRPLLGAQDFATVAGVHTGGLVVVGSHVPKTTAQLELLLAGRQVYPLSLDVASLLDPGQRETVMVSASERVSTLLAEGTDVVVYTSRDLLSGRDAAGSLEIGQRVSDALVALVRGLTVRPRFLIAKGGITSSDLATKGLDVVRAWVRGQILPGIPVWRLGKEARYPGLDYVVFPGNVGDVTALATAFDKFHIA